MDIDNVRLFITEIYKAFLPKDIIHKSREDP